METRKQSTGIAWKALLVVAVIAIAVMVSIVNYAFRYVRESAKQRQCLANLRLLWSASMMYAQDHDGWMPTYINYTRDSPPNRGLQKYSDLVGFSSPEKLRSSLDKYVSDQSAWFCPSAKCISPGKRAIVPDYRYSTYIFHFCKPGILRSDGLLEANLVGRKVPWDPARPRSDGLIRANRRMLRTKGDPRFFPLMEDDPFSALWNGRPAGPHRGGMFNIVYLDGHTQSLKMPPNP